MADIRILPENVVNQIAAGEVIERAASVLKELIENSLDAGSTRIQIIVKGHGRELIQVIDDGEGMSRNDLHLAFERHATSKLSRADDLQSIRTMGFRGEALPSIASVSVVEVRSARGDGTSGTLLRLEGGSILHEEPVAVPRGTSLSVHSLFFNTPARARFLKSAATEYARLVRVYKQYALAYPEIGWSFTHEGKLEYSLPASSLAVRLEDLFGTGMGDKTIRLDFASAGVRLGGVIGTAQLNKRSRGDQFIFLNRRPIQSMLVHSALKSALRDQLEEGEWPFYVALLELDPRDVDVNVHPAKLEVRFADEQRVHAAIYHAVRSALPKPVIAEFSGVVPSTPMPRSGGMRSGAPGAPDQQRMLDLPGGAGAAIQHEDHTAAQAPLYRPAMFQVHDKYLIAQISSGVAIIDQHAAHERILFEKAQRAFHERSFNSQQLLFPMLLELSPEEDALLRELREDLRHLGYQIREFGDRTYSVEAVPAGLRRASEIETLHAMLEDYVEFRRAEFAPRDALAAGFACHTAIRSGDVLSPEEMSALVDELFATQSPLTCPHGRPTVIEIKLSELDRRFKRTE